MKKRITGTTTFQNIETGFWGIIEEDGTKWMIIEMPEQLKFDRRKVEVTLEPIDAMSTMMWGTPASIIAFETLSV